MVPRGTLRHGGSAVSGEIPGMSVKGDGQMTWWKPLWWDGRPKMKISEMGDFPGKDILLEAQKRGGPLSASTNFAEVTLLGLASILAEAGIEVGKGKK